KGEEKRVCKRDKSHSETRKTGKLKKVTESIRIENGKEIEATENADKEIELKVMIKYERAEEKAAESSDVTYSSNNHETATVNSEGVITIKKAGEAEITVESVNGNAEGVRISERIKVTVKHARTEKLEVTSSKRYTLVRGIEDVKQGVTSEATAQIEVKIKYEGYEERAGGKEDVIYKSSNEEVASVDEEGKISFNGEGTATITVESKYEKEGGGKMEESIAVQVNAPPENTTGLEVVSFGNGEIGDKVVIKNVSNNNITTRIVDVYFLDKTNKILGSSFFYLVQSFTPITIKPGEEVSDNIWKVLPVGTTKILIYNERIEETIS
ncbi:MAG: Ig-like domain-containing protein, partial [Christensenellales bacterium]